MNLLSSWYRSSLRSIIWVDSRTSRSVWVFVELLQRNTPDPLVMAAWTCTKLEEVVLLGYKYFEEDIVAIARLRGDVLKRICVADEDVLYSQQMYSNYPDSRTVCIIYLFIFKLFVCLDTIQLAQTTQNVSKH